MGALDKITTKQLIWTTCPHCKGEGTLPNGKACAPCKGLGKVKG